MYDKLKDFYLIRIDKLEKDLNNELNRYFTFKREFDKAESILSATKKVIGSLDDYPETIRALKDRKDLEKEMNDTSNEIVLKFRTLCKDKDDLSNI